MAVSKKFSAKVGLEYGSYLYFIRGTVLKNKTVFMIVSGSIDFYRH